MGAPILPQLQVFETLTRNLRGNIWQDKLGIARQSPTLYSTKPIKHNPEVAQKCKLYDIYQTKEQFGKILFLMCQLENDFLPRDEMK